MPKIDPARSTLLVIDLQERLMPAVDGGDGILANAGRLLAAARLMSVPLVMTEQNPKGLGHTVARLETTGAAIVQKMSFDALRDGALETHLPDGNALVIAGCEAHVCVLQTVLGLLATGRQVHVVADAIGSRRADNRSAAIARMERHGAEIVTTEMVVFEWLGSAEHPQFRAAMALIK